MTRKVKCILCGKQKEIRKNFQKYFYCCGNRWAIKDHLLFQTAYVILQKIGKFVEKPLENEKGVRKIGKVVESRLVVTKNGTF